MEEPGSPSIMETKSKLLPSGVFVEYSLPSAGAAWSIAVREKSVYFTESAGNKIGMVHLPSNLTMMLALTFAGLLTDKFGFAAPFWMDSTPSLIYSASAWHFLRPPKD
jgi:hypothetical protein